MAVSEDLKTELMEMILGFLPRLDRTQDFTVEVSYVDLLVLSTVGAAFERVSREQTSDSIKDAIFKLMSSGVNPKELKDTLDRADAIAARYEDRAPYKA